MKQLVIICFLLSLVDVFSYQNCTQKSDCAYSGCNDVRQSTYSDKKDVWDYSCHPHMSWDACPNCEGKVGCTVVINGGKALACLERQCPAGTFNAASGQCSGQVTGHQFLSCAAEPRGIYTGRCSGRGGGTECVCTRCPKGKYSGAVGATSADTCLACVSGRHSDADGMGTCEEDQPRAGPKDAVNLSQSDTCACEVSYKHGEKEYRCSLPRAAQNPECWASGKYFHLPNGECTCHQTASEMEYKELERRAEAISGEFTPQDIAVTIGALMGGCILGACCYFCRCWQSKHAADNAQHTAGPAVC